MPNELPIAGAQPPQGAPETPQPLSAPGIVVPDGYSSDMAKARLDELKSDREWSARWISGGPSSREAREFDALTRIAVGAPQATAARKPTDNEAAIAGLGAPADISGYDLKNIHTPNGWLHMDQETSQLATTELLPTAKALDLSNADVAMIASSVARPGTYEDCEASLHRLWPGEEFDRGHADFRAALAGNPKARALIEQFPETLGNNAALILSVVQAFRRKAQGRR